MVFFSPAVALFIPNVPPNLTEAFARRLAERDNPPPPPPSQEPAAILARLHAWLRTRRGVRDARVQAGQGRMLLALMQRPACNTAELAAARVAVRLAELGLTTFKYRSRYRYYRLSRATEDAMLEVLTVAGAGYCQAGESGE